MTHEEEREMHELARRLEELTRDTGWEAIRYHLIGNVLEQLTAYCAVCDCQRMSFGKRRRREDVGARRPPVTIRSARATAKISNGDK